MANRGFIGKISRWFSGPSDTYFFGLQLAIKCFGEDTLRGRFARVLEESRLYEQDVQGKKRLLQSLVALLEESALFWSSGYWDYLDDAEAATAEFNTWAGEIEGGINTEELAGAVDNVLRTSSRKDYVVVTLMFLLEQPYAPAEAIANEDASFLKETFASLVHGLLALDPHAIRADGAYIVPGNAEDGLSEDDLYSPGWEYLRMLL